MTEAQRARLFAVYYRCHFGRAVALDLCERTARVNRLIALLTLGCVAGSLLTGTIAFFAADWLKPGWAALNVGSVLMAIWAAIMSYSEKEFDYHQLAASFQKLALEVENFNGFAVFSGSFAEGDIDVIPVAPTGDWYARRVGVAAAREINMIPAGRPLNRESKVRPAGIRA